MNNNQTEENYESGNKLNIIIYILLIAVVSIISYMIFFKKNDNTAESPPETMQNVIKNVSLITNSVQIKLNDVGKIEYNAYSSDGSTIDLTFTSENPNIVTVDNSGFYSGVGVGTTNIVVSYIDNNETKKLNFTITVIEEKKETTENNSSNNWQGTNTNQTGNTTQVTPNPGGNGTTTIPNNNGTSIPNNNGDNTKNNKSDDDDLDKNFKCVDWFENGQCKSWERK